jgi:hypothetical protein
MNWGKGLKVLAYKGGCLLMTYGAALVAANKIKQGSVWVGALLLVMMLDFWSHLQKDKGEK